MTTATSSELLRVIRAAMVAALGYISLAAAAEPPTRVGRLSFTQGDVAFFMDQNEGWQAARLNFPVTGQNSLATESGGRAEVRIGASAWRLDDRSLLDVIALHDEETHLFLRRGTLNIRLRHEDPNARAPASVDGDFRVETSDGMFSLSRNGSFRIESVEGRPETRISVFSGKARFESGDNRISIDTGKALVVRKYSGTEDVHFEAARAGSFDQWADARDRNSERVYTRYSEDRIVSTAMTGYDDLDEHGDWIDDSEYGRLWTPRVVVSDWAPYRYGHWAYVQPWGWTWVDDAAWGFAPFHYGRWVYVSARSRWSWWPGPYVRRPIYAPALVAWLNRPGSHAGNHTGSAWGPSVGWFPLAPREHFVPRYTNNVRYIRNLNQLAENGGALRPPTRYVNHHDGATVVPQDAFQGGRGIAAQRTRHPPSVIAAQIPGNDANFAPRFNRLQVSPTPNQRPTPAFTSNTPTAPVAQAPISVPRPRPTPNNRPNVANDTAIEDRGINAPPRVRRDKPPSERALHQAPSAPIVTSTQERPPNPRYNRPEVSGEHSSKPIPQPVAKAKPVVPTVEAKPEGKHPHKEVDRQ